MLRSWRFDQCKPGEVITLTVTHWFRRTEIKVFVIAVSDDGVDLMMLGPGADTSAPFRG